MKLRPHEGASFTASSLSNYTWRYEAGRHQERGITVQAANKIQQINGLMALRFTAS